MDAEAFLQISGVRAGYGSTRVLDGLDLSIRKGEFVALLGSSGCGKTTLLRTIAGFARPNAGSIRLSGEDVTSLPPDRRGMAMVFQSYALWPHMTVAQNIGYGLRLRRRSRAQIARRVSEIEGLLGLSGLGGRKPAELSGGQRQRVALGRALAVDPQILLLDEPLSNLDARIRLQVRHEIRALQKRLGITAIHVTHDREEAMVMADRIVIMNDGRIAQQGTPEDVYNHPVSPFVASFMGAENTLRLAGPAPDGPSRTGRGPAAISDAPVAGGPVEVRFRAEAAELLAERTAGKAPAGTLELAGIVEATSYPGGLWRHSVQVGDDRVLVDAREAFPAGAAVRIRVPPGAFFLFSAQGAPAAGHDPFPGDGERRRALEAHHT